MAFRRSTGDELDDTVDLTAGKRIVYHRELADELITHMYRPTGSGHDNQDNRLVRMQSGALRYRVGAPDDVAAQETDLKEVPHLEIYKNPEMWTRVQKGFYRGVSRRLTPC